MKRDIYFYFIAFETLNVLLFRYSEVEEVKRLTYGRENV